MNDNLGPSPLLAMADQVHEAEIAATAAIARAEAAGIEAGVAAIDAALRRKVAGLSPTSNCLASLNRAGQPPPARKAANG